MKTVYVIDSWIPFPASEYGGLSVVVASDDDECISICGTLLSSYEVQYAGNIPLAVEDAKRIPTSDETPSGVVASFET